MRKATTVIFEPEDLRRAFKPDLVELFQDQFMICFRFKTNKKKTYEQEILQTYQHPYYDIHNDQR